MIIRRIENKLGIHGSPTCELQFNDTPAQLVGNRRFGLIKYVLDLMYRARMGVSAQALGISQAAYEEAFKYARERRQFGKPIVEIPVVSNMLIDMKVMLESNRSLFYAAAQCVDEKEKLEELVEKKKGEGKPVREDVERLKQITKVANLLTPITKYTLAEGANKITYDALQIHGGTGYMREFHVEQLARDARITNIYEGTSQMQIVAASGGVLNDVLSDVFEKNEKRDFKGGLIKLSTHLKEIRQLFLASLKYVLEKKDIVFQEVAAKDLVEMYSYLHIGYLLLDEAETEPRKVFIANRYIVNALANARKNAEGIRDELFGDLLHARQNTLIDEYSQKESAMTKKKQYYYYRIYDDEEKFNYFRSMYQAEKIRKMLKKYEVAHQEYHNAAFVDFLKEIRPQSRTHRSCPDLVLMPLACRRVETARPERRGPCVFSVRTRFDALNMIRGIYVAWSCQTIAATFSMEIRDKVLKMYFFSSRQ